MVDSFMGFYYNRMLSPGNVSINFNPDMLSPPNSLLLFLVILIFESRKSDAGEHNVGPFDCQVMLVGFNM